eukprot:TRINITY_DN1191_c0_g1_i1.p1 TRINITY_DN1191_c0_g1~~TRINITY_DN1191_c0_g1_i1.p1  ORF type:complete len:163 (-),score=44.13 TRINITY_DN1191_c0_g1_i1:74-508(-)
MIIEEIGESCMDPEDEQTIVWVKAQVNKELDRLRDLGAKVFPIPVKTTSISRQKGQIFNRVELDTGMDFDKIQQIMLSESVNCPTRGGKYQYLNVILFTDKPVGMLLPYLYVPNEKNKLQDWLFINCKGQRSQHRVSAFEQVTQ